MGMEKNNRTPSLTWNGNKNTLDFFVLKSVEGAPTVGCTTQAGDFVFLDGELVVIGDFLSHGYVALGVDDNLLLGAKADHFCVAVRLRKEKSRKI